MKTDVRIVAATHRDLNKMVLAGEFREDLYYRLNVFPIRVPALRERRDDIPPLVAYFVLKYAEKMGKKIETIPIHVQETLRQYDWPGNIRELQNIIERAVILCQNGTLHIDGTFGKTFPTAEAPETATTRNDDRRSLSQVERGHIQNVLTQTDWRIAGEHGAAVILDLHPNTLRSRMKKIGIKKEADDS